MNGAQQRDRILAVAGPAARHLSPPAEAVVEWLASQNEEIIDGIVELLGAARALAGEPASTPARPRASLPLPRRLPVDTVGNSGP
jgi:hypothetical protein